MGPSSTTFRISRSSVPCGRSDFDWVTDTSGIYIYSKMCRSARGVNATVRINFLEIGAGDRIRTGDIDLGKVALYQLSYSRSMETFIFAQEQSRCQTLW